MLSTNHEGFKALVRAKKKRSRTLAIVLPEGDDEEENHRSPVKKRRKTAKAKPKPKPKPAENPDTKLNKARLKARVMVEGKDSAQKKTDIKKELGKVEKFTDRAVKSELSLKREEAKQLFGQRLGFLATRGFGVFMDFVFGGETEVADEMVADTELHSQIGGLLTTTLPNLMIPELVVAARTVVATGSALSRKNANKKRIIKPSVLRHTQKSVVVTAAKQKKKQKNNQDEMPPPPPITEAVMVKQPVFTPVMTTK